MTKFQPPKSKGSRVIGSERKSFWLRARGFVPRGIVLNPEQFQRKMDLKMAQKILQGKLGLKIAQNFNFQTTQTRSGRKLDLAYPKVKLKSDLFCDNFFLRVIKDFNKLSLDERDAKKGQFSVAAEKLVKKTQRELRPNRHFQKGRLRFSKRKRKSKH